MGAVLHNRTNEQTRGEEHFPCGVQARQTPQMPTSSKHVGLNYLSYQSEPRLPLAVHDPRVG
ncbi:hypothetical protein [Ornithinimicrobium kibberense]|uniref:hypothetical protein n=1 Tax=Ornithinimicrobium kibberense TaxID=282060 RepID=UPI003621504A